MDDNFINTYLLRRWSFILLTIPAIKLYYNVYVYNNISFDTKSLKNYHNSKEIITYYKYPLLNSSEISMDYEDKYESSYYWFISMKHLFRNIGEEEIPSYPKFTYFCQLNKSSLGPIAVNKTKLDIEWVKNQHMDVKSGGFHAPAQCRARYHVAIVVPYRSHPKNLAIFLHYMHSLLKKQLLEYRIFVIEQFAPGKEKWVKGTLYNIAFLETQRFGSWDCLVFHDMDLIPEDERILYSCPRHPTHMSTRTEQYGYQPAYPGLFDGVTSLTPAQFRAVNGYSNFYWNWGAEDVDMYIRLKSRRYRVQRYNGTIARYASLTYEPNLQGKFMARFLYWAKIRFHKEGLRSTKYNIIKISKEKLYTYVLADVTPTRQSLEPNKLVSRLYYKYMNSPDLRNSTFEGLVQGVKMHHEETTTAFSRIP